MLSRCSHRGRRCANQLCHACAPFSGRSATPADHDAAADVQSVGLGGGSVVRVEPNSGSVTVGPDSVGHNLVKEALVFGGSTLTTTDITVASGARKVGNPSLVEGKVASEVMVKAKHRMKVVMERIIDR